MLGYVIAFGLGVVATVVAWALWVTRGTRGLAPEEVARRVEHDRAVDAKLKEILSHDPVDRANDAIERLKR